jgi:tRNA modification GTPase
VNPSASPTTWVACLTPPGRGALATLALYGPHAWDVVRALFHWRSGRELPAAPEPGRFWLGRMGEPAAEAPAEAQRPLGAAAATTTAADDVVLAVKQAEPIPWVEVHAHGGREVVRFLLELCTARGGRPCTWQEFLHHTTQDSLQAQAAVALTAATTLRTAAILLDQHQRALSRALSAVASALDQGDAPAAVAGLGELTRWGALGRHLTTPWRVVIAGAPNVGKSSLVNALAGYQRSVVDPTPGTTRDVVTARLALDGWPVELADTAGLRAEAESLEAEGIAKAHATAAGADLCLWVLDGSAPPVWPTFSADSVRLVINKVDLPPAWDWARAAAAPRVSAQTGAGIPELCAAVSRWLVPEAPPLGAAVPFTDSLATMIETARQLVQEGRLAEARQALSGIDSGNEQGGNT